MLRFPHAWSRALRSGFFFASLWIAAGVARGDDPPRPSVGVGATKEQVIDAYGWPNGASQLGTREILNYAQGTVTLEKGRVEHIDFLPNVPWQKPKPRPGAGATASDVSAAKSPTTGYDPWLTSLADATAQATKRKVRILTLFVGSDWSPPSKKFLDEVATHPDFVNPLLDDFVFLKADFPTRIAPSAELRQQNDELRARCGVSTYPALVVLSPRGEPVATIDLLKPSPDGYRAGVIAGIADVRELLRQQPLLLPPAVAVGTSLEKPKAGPTTAPGDAATGAVLSTAEWILFLGLGAGAVLAGAGIWWVRRGSQQAAPAAQDAAKNVFSGLGLGHAPTPAELKAWPVERLRLLVAALCEEENYQATLRADSPAELELTAADAKAPGVLVHCWSAAAGPAHAKALRTFSGALVAGDIAQGWFVSTGGFFDEARALAHERGITLIEGDELVARLKKLPALGLRRVLARGESVKRA